MTRKGAQLIIESLSQRFLEIQDVKERLEKEEESLRARILELEQVQDSVSVMPVVIVNDEVLPNGQG